VWKSFAAFAGRGSLGYLREQKQSGGGIPAVWGNFRGEEIIISGEKGRSPGLFRAIQVKPCGIPV
jgi:hypothetical protein